MATDWVSSSELQVLVRENPCRQEQRNEELASKVGKVTQADVRGVRDIYKTLSACSGLILSWTSAEWRRLRQATASSLIALATWAKPAAEPCRATYRAEVSVARNLLPNSAGDNTSEPI